MGLCDAIFCAAGGGKFDPSIYYVQTHKRSVVTDPRQIQDLLIDAVARATHARSINKRS
jgi:hypothetical protein